MKRFSIMVVSILAMILSVQVLAQEDDGEGLADNANACYTRGLLEGKCSNSDLDLNGVVDDWEIDLMWTCGWYLIRYEHGSGFLPQNCEFLLVVPGAPICYTNGEVSFIVVGPFNQLGNFISYSSTDCSGPGSNVPDESILIAGDQSTAQAICTGLLGTWGLAFSPSDVFGFNTPPDYWGCFAAAV